MKVARLYKKELRDLLHVAHLIDSVCHPRSFTMPFFPNEYGEPGDGFDPDRPEDLKRFYEEVKALSSWLMAAALGYQTLLSNYCCPNSDVLELNNQLSGAIEDQKRVDWVNELHAGWTFFDRTGNYHRFDGTFRVAVDAAMAEEVKE